MISSLLQPCMGWTFFNANTFEVSFNAWRPLKLHYSKWLICSLALTTYKHSVHQRYPITSRYRYWLFQPGLKNNLKNKIKIDTFLMQDVGSTYSDLPTYIIPTYWLWSTLLDYYILMYLLIFFYCIQHYSEERLFSCVQLYIHSNIRTYGTETVHCPPITFNLVNLNDWLTISLNHDLIKECTPLRPSCTKIYFR